MEDKVDKILQISEKVNKSIDASNSWLSRFLNFSEKLLVPVMLGVVAFFVNNTSNNISQAQLELSDLESQRRGNEFKTQIQTKYIELFYDDISSGDPIRQASALKLLRVMDNDLATSFASLVSQQEGVSEVLREKALKIRSGVEFFTVMSGYKIGIYTIPTNSELPELANEISINIKERGFNGIVQIYKKDENFFNKFGYPKENEIRYEEGIEEAQADFLVEFMSDLYPEKRFIKRQVKSRTANFISIFLK